MFLHQYEDDKNIKKNYLSQLEVRFHGDPKANQVVNENEDQPSHDWSSEAIHLSLPFLLYPCITNVSVFLNLLNAKPSLQSPNLFSNYMFLGKGQSLLIPVGRCHVGDSATPRERKSVEYIAEHTSYAHGTHRTCCALERRKSEMKTSLKQT